MPTAYLVGPRDPAWSKTHVTSRQWNWAARLAAAIEAGVAKPLGEGRGRSPAWIIPGLLHRTRGITALRRGVGTAGCVGVKRIDAAVRVVAAARVAKERLHPVGGVIVTGRVRAEGLHAMGSIVEAGPVRLHRVVAGGGVVVAVGVVLERGGATGGVVEAGRVLLQRGHGVGRVVRTRGVALERPEVPTAVF